MVELISMKFRMVMYSNTDSDHQEIYKVTYIDLEIMPFVNF